MEIRSICVIGSIDWKNVAKPKTLIQELWVCFEGNHTLAMLVLGSPQYRSYAAPTNFVTKRGSAMPSNWLTGYFFDAGFRGMMKRNLDPSV